MASIHIVTDSLAHFSQANFTSHYPVTVIPNLITIGDQRFREGVDMSNEDAMQLAIQHQVMPRFSAPTEADFMQVYQHLAQMNDAIISIHPSRKLSESWHNALSAAQQLAGHCKIEVVDSQLISVAQAMVVRATARLLAENFLLDDVVRQLRGIIERMYTIFCVDEMNGLLQPHILSSSHVLLGAMLEIRPFLSMEDGELRPVEKVRTRIQALEQLVEFVTEFTDIEDVVIVQNHAHPTDEIRTLQERLSLEFPDRHFPYTLYGPSLTALLGSKVIGIALLESELEYIEDDF